MKKILMTMILMAVAGATAAYGQNAEKAAGKKAPGKGMLEAMDANGDGQVTADEFKAFMTARAKERFGMIDANGDGKVTPDEFKAAVEKMKEKMGGAGGARHEGAPEFSAFDTDGNGVITLQEFTDHFVAERMKMFTKMDKNGDGVLTKDEIEAMRNEHGGRGGHKQGPAGTRTDQATPAGGTTSI